ncbi:hypothetical protein T440DRAFT_392016 [Plenodomus tracheiphilus IPT5]|uniref:Indole-diterpene biosynthesis protein-like protein PaxU n=1 Tax=Plenodomus tracheiphilus IPT5 TaxID=1408161 RepID=A0A6A7BBG6_9PLEO|nr:hypothetical protein T440DRAFT_392016 [Plenodomus tracheiphilus IPT5]
MSTPPPKPLSDFQKIGHNTYLWTSSAYLSQPAQSTPLILLFTWNAAAAKHIAKYTVAYQKLFPKSRIILIRCFTPDMFRRTSAYAPLLKPAMDLVAEHTKLGGEVLVHSWSNGGGNQINEFAKAWVKQYGEKLPMRAQILDSAPTKGPWMKSHAAISASLPKTTFWRWFGGVAVHLLLVATFLVNVVRRRENKMVVLCRELNDEKTFDKRVPRVYLYSRADLMVGFEEADEHADIAKGKGWDVTKVQFEKSAHCGHVREDEGKYWGAIMEAWKKGPRDEEM